MKENENESENKRDKQDGESASPAEENQPYVNENGLEESTAAKRLRMTGGEMLPEEDYSDIPKTFRSRISNFWYHHKSKVLIVAFFAIAIGIAVGQFATQSNPDVCILYCGPDYITANDNQKFCAVIREFMDEDFNDDGEKKVRLTDIIYRTQSQVEEAQAEAEALGEDFTFDVLSNQKTSEKFSYEVFGGDSVICILAEEQYTQVMKSDGFLPLREIFDGAEVEGAIDDYGIRLSETKFYQFYTAAHIFPDDAVIALRRVSTMSAVTGQRKKAEASHAYHMELFKKIVNFQFPEGYDVNSMGSGERAS